MEESQKPVLRGDDEQPRRYSENHAVDLRSGLVGAILVRWGSGGADEEEESEADKGLIRREDIRTGQHSVSALPEGYYCNRVAPTR
ncbi:hypothetical protein K3495_g14183 [Podosphaera aphanis]|nr:hypothetical protein K3495_g14183 [Podosphaera aphanis]